MQLDAKSDYETGTVFRGSLFCSWCSNDIHRQITAALALTGSSCHPSVLSGRMHMWQQLPLQGNFPAFLLVLVHWSCKRAQCREGARTWDASGEREIPQINTQEWDDSSLCVPTVVVWELNLVCWASENARAAGGYSIAGHRWAALDTAWSATISRLPGVLCSKGGTWRVQRQVVRVLLGRWANSLSPRDHFSSSGLCFLKAHLQLQ